MNTNAVLGGSLNFLNLGEVLQLLGSNSSTGILRLTSQYAQGVGFIYIADGNPIDASNGSLTGLDAIYSLFGWIEGEFEFTEDEVQTEAVIKKGRMEIILDSLSMLDDGAIEKLGPESMKKEVQDSADADLVSTIPVIRGPIVDYIYVVDEEEYFDGREIVVEGKYGSWSWVILEGVVEIVKETSEGRVKILRIGDGSFIGGIASLLMGSYVRGATTIAVGNVQLGVLDSQRLSDEFSRMSSEFKRFATSLDRRLKQVTDRAVDISLKRNSVKDFVEGKELLIKQGESDEKLFTITEGEAYVVRHTDIGDVPLAILYKEDFFGHVPFLDMEHEPYSASVYGSDDLETNPLDPENLQKELNKLSPTLKNIIENAANCISATTMVACEFQKKANLEKP